MVSTLPTLTLLALLVASIPNLTSAQSPPGGALELGLRQRADTAFSSSDWTAAVDLYTRITELAPEDATAWFRIGLATLQAEGDSADAIAAFEAAIERGYAEAPALFGIARAHAIDRQGIAAIEQIERLADFGPSRGIAQRLETGAEFAPLRNVPRFQTALARIIPCNTPEYRQFDFWLGSWEVQNPQGQVVGRNTISELSDRCILFEDWEGTSGHKGLSLNYFDPRDRTWNQIFRDNTGNIAAWPDLKGGFLNGSMILESPTGIEPRSRWIWTKISEDKVRQMAESSGDGGETWTVIWDSYYIRQD